MEEYIGRENLITAEKLENGIECLVMGVGNSMTPILKSKQLVRVKPIKDCLPINKNDIVFVKVNGHFYLHKVSAVKNGSQFQISNNHGHINGWVTINSIYGKVVEIL